MDVRVTQDATRARIELLLSVSDLENLRDGLDDLLASEGSYPAYWFGSEDGAFVVLHRLDRPGHDTESGTHDGGFRPWTQER